jgi:soluble lytic murein transglycosylase-like protein
MSLGLMQVIPKYHKEKINTVSGPLNMYTTEANIKVGTEILREYTNWYSSLDKSLRQYNGSLNDPDNTYPKLVHAEREKLRKYILEQQ